MNLQPEPIHVFLPITLSPVQNEIIATHDAHRFTLVVGGRQFGKTTTACAVGLRDAVQGAEIWWVVPTHQPYASAALSKLKSWVYPLMKHFEGIKHAKAEDKFIFPGGGYIQIQTAFEPQRLRSATLDKVIFDEAAFAPEAAWEEGLLPTLMVRKGKALFITSPNGRNWIYKKWLYALTAGDPDWATLHYTSYNGFIDPEEIDKARKHNPERKFRQEFLGEFIDDASSVFRGVHEAATADYQFDPVPGHVYVGGLDWGRVEDFTTLVIIDATERRMVHLDRFNQIGWELQSNRIREACEHWKPAVVWAESNAVGQSVTDALIASGLPVRPFHMNPTSKPPLIQSLALAIEQRQIELLNDTVLVNELLSFEEIALPSGGYRYSAPKGMHDDTVIASALAWYGVTGSIARAPTMTFVQGTGLYGSGSRRQYPQWGDYEQRKPFAEKARRRTHTRRR